MAGDWIQMRGALINHPKIIAMARLLEKNPAFREWLTPGGGGPVNGQIVSNGALQRVVTGALLCLWSASREHGNFVGDDLELPFSAVSDLDEMAGTPGLGEAIIAVEWALVDDSGTGIILPNFKENNTPKTNAERQSAYRKRQKKDGEPPNHPPQDSNETVTSPLQRNVTNVTTKGEESIEETSPTGSQRKKAAPEKDTTPKKEKKKKGTRLPDDWTLPPEGRAWAEQHTPNIDIDWEAQKFADHFHASSQKTAVKLDWQATWRNWARRASEGNGGNHGNEISGRSGRKSSASADYWADIESRGALDCLDD